MLPTCVGATFVNAQQLLVAGLILTKDDTGMAHRCRSLEIYHAVV